MSERKFYWLKLKDDFFDSKRIKKLRKLAGGDTYVIIYLKMQLKAMQTDGVLTWTGLESEFAAELALDIDEEPDNVSVTLNYLISCGLAETSDNVNFFLPYAVENTSSETSAAARMRKMRERNAVTAQLRSSYTEKDIDIEKDIEIEKEPKKRGVFQEFAGDDKELLQALREFNDFRNRKKKPLTDEAKERLCKRLNNFQREQWIEIIHQSIDQGWTDIYPLKNQQAEETEKTKNRNAPVSNDPKKWDNEGFKNAIGDLLNG